MGETPKFIICPFCGAKSPDMKIAQGTSYYKCNGTKYKKCSQDWKIYADNLTITYELVSFAEEEKECS